MSVKVVFPSAGHHNADPGAVYGGRKEGEEMKCFRDLVIQFLNEKGHANIPDRDYETAGQHQARIKTGEGSVVCEFHLNASVNASATGTEAVVKNYAPAYTIAMAQELTATVSEILGIRNRGIIPDTNTPRGRIGIVNKAGITVLLEICFLSNPSDMAAYDQHKVELAKKVAEILIKFDNLI